MTLKIESCIFYFTHTTLLTQRHIFVSTNAVVHTQKFSAEGWCWSLDLPPKDEFSDGDCSVELSQNGHSRERMVFPMQRTLVDSVSSKPNVLNTHAHGKVLIALC
jgi:hypothetical protein